MKKLNILISLGLFAACTAFAAGEVKPEAASHSSSPVDGGQSITFRQLDELRSRNAILAQMVKAAKLQAELDTQKSGGTANAGGPASGAYPQGSPANIGALPGSQQFMMAAQPAQVVEVSGMQGQVAATLSVPNAGLVKARVGQTIQGLGTIKSISRDQVLVSNKGEITSIPFAPIGGGR